MFSARKSAMRTRRTEGTVTQKTLRLNHSPWEVYGRVYTQYPRTLVVGLNPVVQGLHSNGGQRATTGTGGTQLDRLGSECCRVAARTLERVSTMHHWPDYHVVCDLTLGSTRSLLSRIVRTRLLGANSSRKRMITGTKCHQRILGTRSREVRS